MIAVESNILVYSHRVDSPWYVAASRAVGELWRGDEPWAIPWPSIHEFLSVSTNRRIYRPPSSLDEALKQVRTWMLSPSLRLLAETPDYIERLEAVVQEGAVTGGMVHDARIAALCLHHGVSELLTADRDFSRFPSLMIRNPLLGWSAPIDTFNTAHSA